jgi:DNA polymerase-1
MNLLLIDAPNLCYRAFYTTGGLRHDGVATGVVYGLLRDVGILRGQFKPDRIAFCFDEGRNKREQLLPSYKKSRREKVRTEDEARAYLELQEQIQQLKTDYLSGLGYSNVFYTDGYEADDVIATICQSSIVKLRDDQVVIVSSDTDLYQLLSPNVRQYDPRTKLVWDEEYFRRTYGIVPVDWAHVKAISGCSSDEVPGIPGIGTKTALKHLRNELGPMSAARLKIKAGWTLWRNNLKLVQLPFDFKQSYVLQDDNVTIDKWRKLADRLGFRSLPPPISVFTPK